MGHRGAPFQSAGKKELDAHQRYEAEKQRWIAEHPDATPREYEQAMLRIAMECGL